jgi:hypothetical protein
VDVIADIHFQVISASPRAGGKPFMDDIEMTLIAKRTLAACRTISPFMG